MEPREKALILEICFLALLGACSSNEGWLNPKKL